MEIVRGVMFALVALASGPRSDHERRLVGRPTCICCARRSGRPRGGSRMGDGERKRKATAWLSCEVDTIDPIGGAGIHRNAGHGRACRRLRGLRRLWCQSQCTTQPSDATHVPVPPALAVNRSGRIPLARPAAGRSFVRHWHPIGIPASPYARWSGAGRARTSETSALTWRALARVCGERAPRERLFARPFSRSLGPRPNT